MNQDDMIEAQHRAILLARLDDMKKAGWTQAEMATAIAAWPLDWRQLAGR